MTGLWWWFVTSKVLVHKINLPFVCRSECRVVKIKSKRHFTLSLCHKNQKKGLQCWLYVGVCIVCRLLNFCFMLNTKRTLLVYLFTKVSIQRYRYKERFKRMRLIKTCIKCGFSFDSFIFKSFLSHLTGVDAAPRPHIVMIVADDLVRTLTCKTAPFLRLRMFLFSCRQCNLL